MDYGTIIPSRKNDRVRTATPPLLWAQRAALVVVALVAPWNIVAQHSTAVNVVIILIGWSAWTLAAVSALVVLPVGLTAQRLTVPLIMVSTVVSLWSSSHRAVSVVGIVACVLATHCMLSPSVVMAMVQGSAFGKEQRFPLRTPVPHIAPAIVSWLLVATSVCAGPLLLAARQWIAGGIVSAIALVLVSRVPVRIHRLARRWLVLVPAGIVVHDHVVLGETLMVRNNEVRRVLSIPSAGDEADLTGGSLGPRVRIELLEAAKVVLTPITAKTLGTTEALHVQSFAISPIPHDVAFAALIASVR